MRLCFLWLADGKTGNNERVEKPTNNGINKILLFVKKYIFILKCSEQSVNRRRLIQLSIYSNHRNMENQILLANVDYVTKIIELTYRETCCFILRKFGLYKIMY